MSEKRSIKERFSGLKVTGFSTPIGGVQWTPPIDERQIIHRFLKQMADRRLIRHWHGGFEYASVVRSCETIRNNVTHTISELSPESPTIAKVETVRDAIHIFQNIIEEEYPKSRYDYKNLHGEATPKTAIFEALAEMRRVVGGSLKVISDGFDLPLPDGIAQEFRL